MIRNNSVAYFDAEGQLHRTPRAPQRARPAGFLERYEQRLAYYDCFRYGDDVLLVGPPAYGFEEKTRRFQFAALPGALALEAKTFQSVSVRLTRLTNVPKDVRDILVRTPDGQELSLVIQPSSITEFSGSRLLFTMSKDNDLAWIAEWARYHRRFHGTDAVVFFDNGSSRYGMDEIEAVIAQQGIDKVAVHSWPYLYGTPDPAIRNNPFYTLFPQVSSMSVVLRRYGAQSVGILNCDIDELTGVSSGESIYACAKRSAKGLIVMRGRYIEPMVSHGGEPKGDHRDYWHYQADPKLSTSRPKKWCLDPQRDWVKSLAVHPYMHWIENRPWFSKTMSDDVFYRHFRAINTNWKDKRTETRPAPDQRLMVDEFYKRQAEEQA